MCPRVNLLSTNGPAPTRGTQDDGLIKETLLWEMKVQHLLAGVMFPRKFLKEIGDAVSDLGSGVRSKGERPPTRGVPNHTR